MNVVVLFVAASWVKPHLLGLKPSQQFLEMSQHVIAHSIVARQRLRRVKKHPGDTSVHGALSMGEGTVAKRRWRRTQPVAACHA
jgi:hypothetical protein